MNGTPTDGIVPEPKNVGPNPAQAQQPMPSVGTMMQGLGQQPRSRAELLVQMLRTR